MKNVFFTIVLAAFAVALPSGGVAIDPVTSAKQLAKVDAVVRISTFMGDSVS